MLHNMNFNISGLLRLFTKFFLPTFSFKEKGSIPVQFILMYFTEKE